MTNNLSKLFGKDQDFLSHTLSSTHAPQAIKSIILSSGELRLTQPGILVFLPNTASKNGLILSAGIHGNETAPIELLNRLVQDVLSENLRAERPILIILGNPEAMSAQERFVEFNLNRLFCGTHQDDTYRGSIEAKRAALIETTVKAFHSSYPVSEHYDLHTAIRASEHPRFALYPYREGFQAKPEQKQVLSLCGIEALVHQHASSSTFSSFTMNECGSESYTLELGKVKPFGENDLNDYQNVLEALSAIVADKPPEKSSKPLLEYSVVHEIINTGPRFKLNIEEQVSNFTAYARGETIWEDASASYQVKQPYEHIIFPNSHVPKGQRAGLMIKKMNK